jgi:mannose-6-phosphate isomerase-like protein (cupin superfamily)
MNDDAPSTMQAFKYETPPADQPRKTVWLCRTEHLVGAVQMLMKGGEQALHSHAHLDGFWFVLKGRARFYSDQDTVFAEVGPHEGVLVPRGTKYWFEAVKGEPLELLQVEASDIAFKTRDELRKDVTYYAERAPGSIIKENIEAKSL